VSCSLCAIEGAQDAFRRTKSRKEGEEEEEETGKTKRKKKQSL